MTNTQLMLGDCLSILPTIPDNSVDLILTSPPYNFGMDYEGYDDNQPNYIETLSSILAECKRLLVSGGRLIINIQPNYKNYSPTHHLITQACIDLDLIWRGEILWVKNNIKKLTAWGSYMSPSSPYLSYPFEFIEVFSKNTIKHKGNKQNIDISKDEFIKYVNGLWTFTPETKMKDIGHPAMFPEELVYRCLKLFTYKDDVVLDPFMGAGTTGLVCKKLDRNFIGIEQSPDYLEIATHRINN